MKKSQLRPTWVLASLLLALTAFFGLYYLYYSMVVINPVREKLNGLEFVTNSRINREKGHYTIEVEIAQAGSVKKEYQQIDNIVLTNFKPGQYNIKLLDNRSSKLQRVYDDLELSIYEAIAKDNLLWLDEQLQLLAKKNNCSGQVFVDPKRLYVQLQDGDSFLCEIIDRPGQHLNNSIQLEEGQ